MTTAQATSRRGRWAKRWSERDRRERGIAIVWLAITLLLMVLFAGFAVDMSNWYLRAERIQRAADSGALAGAAFMPGNLSGATTEARSVVTKNGYPLGGVRNTTVAVSQEANPNQVRVKITTDVPTFFLGLIGMDKLRMTREAVGEYVAPVPMGSPQNKLGNDPDGTDPGTQMWVNISGPSTAKEQGDRYQSRTCGSGVYGCSGSTNTEYAEQGYFYSLNVTSKGSGDLIFQVFDAPWVNVGTTCGTNMPSAAQRTNLVPKYGADATTRYNGATVKYCSGDMHPGTTPVNTTFRFLLPDNTPWNNTDNLPVPGCPPVTVDGFNPGNANAIYDRLMHATTGRLDPNDGVVSFGESFRRWATMCTVSNSNVVVGKYIVQVRTNVTAASPTTYNSSITTSGHNHMSFRTGFGTTGLNSVDGTNVTVNALGRLPIYANASGADTRFFMARVLPADKGRTLRINLFDMGEGSQPGTLQILPPADYTSMTGKTAFSGCSISRDNGGSLSVSPSTCTLSNVSSSSFNGRLLTIDVPIPADYTCNPAVVTGCWIKIKAAYPVGASVTDATTWSAAILGNPIRIVE